MARVAGAAGAPRSRAQASSRRCFSGSSLAPWRRRFHVARIAAAAQVSLILWGWLFAQYPYIVPPALSIRGAAAPAVTLRLLAIGLAAGAAVLLPSLRYLLRTFKGRVRVAP